MKISYITMQFPVPSETFASQDINMLLDLENNVDVYCLRPKHKQYKSLIEERHKDRKIKITHLSIINFLVGFSYIFLHPIKSFSLIKWIFLVNKSLKDIIKSLVLLPSIFYIFRLLQKNKPDIVHLFWGHYPSILSYLLKEYMPEIPFTMFLGAHDLETRYEGSVYMSKFAKKVFTHSFDNIKPLINIGIQKDKIKVLHRGTVVEDRILQGVKSKTLNIENFTFLTASRLIQEKGVDEVIDIFVKFTQNNPNSKLFIAGDGPYKEELNKQVKNYVLEDKIIFLGHISQNELFSYMNEADFFILMSRYKAERLPNVLKEAMLRKCICITTFTTGIEELIEHNNSGYIFETKEEVIELLGNIQENTVKVNNIKEEAQKCIVKNFNVKETMKEYIKIWQASLGKKHE